MSENTTYKVENKNYITPEGTFHFRTLFEGNNTGDFGNFFNICEVNMNIKEGIFTSNDVVSEALNTLPRGDDPKKSKLCSGEYRLIKGDNIYIGDFNEYSWDISEIPLNKKSIIFNGNGNSVLLSSNDGSSIVSFNSDDALKGYIRINDFLILSENIKTLITKEGTIYTQNIEELYKYIGE